MGKVHKQYRHLQNQNRLPVYWWSIHWKVIQRGHQDKTQFSPERSSFTIFGLFRRGLALQELDVGNADLPFRVLSDHMSLQSLPAPTNEAVKRLFVPNGHKAFRNLLIINQMAIMFKSPFFSMSNATDKIQLGARSRPSHLMTP